MASNKLIAETEQTLTYVIGEVIYLPHYIKKGVYVSPGYGKYHFKEYSAKDLIQAGAKVKTELLFVRSW